ncbi:MAG: hypothetical protein OXF79_28660 [Chloroflexi bacterium]|nr:hypothetical protein [Chloroflexota bacterium]
MTAPVQTTVKHLHAPKLKETEKDYQDHFDVRVRPTDNPMVIAAIADGATDSAFAARWAQELTQLFVECPPANEEGLLSYICEWLKPAQDAWHESVPWDRVPWHGIDKARRGAVATFLGITIESADDGQLKLQSIAVGDCELIIIDSENQVTMKFPVAEASEFNNRPDLICSNPNGNQGIDGQVKRATASIGVNDQVILTTDAMAEWLLREELSPAMYRQIAQMDDAAFAAWLQSERDNGRIKNDDTTIAIIEFTSPDLAPS